jgi:hypothetical protein
MLRCFDWSIVNRRFEGALRGLLDPAHGDAKAPPKRRHLKDITA